MHSWMQARLMVWRFGWWWGLKRLFLEEKYTSSPYWEVIFTDEILRVFLRDLHDPMSLNKASACFSVNTLDFAKAFSSPASYSRRGTMFAGGWYIFEQKCLTSRWNGMNWWDILVTCYLRWTHILYTRYNVFAWYFVASLGVFANMEKEKTIHPHRRRSSIFAGVFCSLEASGWE